MQKGKWKGLKGVLALREMSEDIFLNGYKKYLNLVIYECLADPVGVFYLMRSVGILSP